MRNAAETREKLLETATGLIWQSNYSSVGVNEICKQAGVTKGAFYHHFESKADLFIAASRHYWDRMKRDMDAIYSPSFTPLEQLENLIQLIIEKQINECSSKDMEVAGCPFFTSGGQAGIDEEKICQAAREMEDHMQRYSVALVRGLKADGALRGDPDVDQIARFLHHFVQGLLIYGRLMNSLDAVRADLREGIYRLLDLKDAYRSEGAEQPVSSAADAA
ncbi:TetR/AcrR family transcriptional regulator [Denitrobaculum tricleocarpae]|uniref:TetR/AcrR family transcriptional regulator n=1 Tax=Denitrobaculum tricleocarpae TaxID=2591009 RepID=A0A545TEZ8_9PROT|nr:TetR/AcrR family transcriptional regulator [Denitrobaculum tricleocarpae]TQV75812.1 TetR/AcrR family transcriptional regulator [Denitrobaculum tricleocarpae]